MECQTSLGPGEGASGAGGTRGPGLTFWTHSRTVKVIGSACTSLQTAQWIAAINDTDFLIIHGGNKTLDMNFLQTQLSTIWHKSSCFVTIPITSIIPNIEMQGMPRRYLYRKVSTNQVAWPTFSIRVDLQPKSFGKIFVIVNRIERDSNFNERHCLINGFSMHKFYFRINLNFQNAPCFRHQINDKLIFFSIVTGVKREEVRPCNERLSYWIFSSSA